MAKAVLVTGADGFVGRNLCAALRQLPGVTLLTFDVGNRVADLAGYVGVADFVFHLAGVMRPANPAEFAAVNTDLTVNVLGLLRKKRRPVPILLSSSIQAALDNPYGASKRAAEDAVFAYGRETGADVYVYRLPNLFGKWGRPNYSSVVATWCHNIAHDLPIHVRDPSAVLTLGYIDDVTREWLAVLDGRGGQTQHGFCELPLTHTRTLGQIAEILYRFKASLNAHEVPEGRDDFERDLCATFLSYL